MDVISFSAAMEAGLRVINPRIPPEAEIRFEGLSDPEVLCYVMINCVGWAPYRLSRYIHLSHPTIRRYADRAAARRCHVWVYQTQ